MDAAHLMDVIRSHGNAAYAILFLGTFLETLIPFSFFVYGEVFFIAGAVLAGLGVLDIRLVSAVLFGAGMLGDSASYAIGRTLGRSIFRPGRKWFNHTNARKGEVFFRRYGGARAVFFGRLLGPMSWITPFFAGIYRVRYARFIRYDVPGVIIGIGQFIVAGYVFAGAWRVVLPLVQRYTMIAAAVIAGASLAAVFFIRWRKASGGNKTRR